MTSLVASSLGLARSRPGGTARVLGEVAAGAAIGAAAWTLTEYSVHRWILHGPFAHGRWRRIPIGSVHRHHHRDPNHTVPAARAAAGLAMTALGAAAGRRMAAAAPAGLGRVVATAGTAWGVGYAVYDMVHWSLHHRRPKTRVGRRLRQRHFRHHFGASHQNLGVTTPFWDQVFDTEAANDRLRVPARSQPSWFGDLIDPAVDAADEGALAPLASPAAASAAVSVAG